MEKSQFIFKCWWLRQQSICLQCRRLGFNPWVGKISWRRKWQPTPVFLPGKSHGRRSLVDYSPRYHKESDTTERLHFHFLHGRHCTSHFQVWPPLILTKSLRDTLLCHRSLEPETVSQQSTVENVLRGDFPGGPAANPRSQCKGPRFDSWSGN